MQKKTINKIIKDSYKKALSIQFSLDGFSFCVYNSTTKEVQHFTSYSFDETVKTPELLLEKIQELVNTHASILNQDFGAVKIIHQNNLSTLVPDDLFDEKELTSYLDYNIKTLATDFIAFDNLSQQKIKNVYIPYVNVNNYFFQQFGEFEYNHLSTILIDKLTSINNSEKQFFVNVSKHSFDIVVLENSELLFYNTFSFNTKEDFIYYILFTAEQLELNPEKFNLTFLGEIEKTSELYSITFDYIRNINFLNVNNPFEKNIEFSNHAHFISLP